MIVWVLHQKREPNANQQCPAKDGKRDYEVENKFNLFACFFRGMNSVMNRLKQFSMYKVNEGRLTSDICLQIALRAQPFDCP